MSDCEELCDGCPRRAEHHLCDECCHAEPDAINQENMKLHAQVADLKARLKAVRAKSSAVRDWHLLDRATDLRVRKWRKP